MFTRKLGCCLKAARHLSTVASSLRFFSVMANADAAARRRAGLWATVPSPVYYAFSR